MCFDYLIIKPTLLSSQKQDGYGKILADKSIALLTFKKDDS